MPELSIETTIGDDINETIPAKVWFDYEPTQKLIMSGKNAQPYEPATVHINDITGINEAVIMHGKEEDLEPEDLERITLECLEHGASQ